MKFTLIATLQQTPIQHIQFVETLAQQMGKEFTVETRLWRVANKNSKSKIKWEDYAAENSVDMLFISCHNQTRIIRQWLNACRNLRLPYVFITDTMHKINTIQRILIPVSMLQEEIHKAEIGVHIARGTGAKTILLQAKDYGNKASQTVQKISELYDKFTLPYEVTLAKKNSFGILKETAQQHNRFTADIAIITATREYALDDIIFGPPELYAIKHSNIPVVLLNPRKDLYTLCN